MAIKRIHLTLIAGLALITNVRCREPYILPSSSANLNILVVEGVISTGSDSIIIRLSRTVKLTDTVSLIPETRATVALIDPSGGAIAPFTEIRTGFYYAPGLNSVEAPGNYRLKIVTSAGKNYLSDALTVKNSPPIDSLTFGIGSNGIEIYSTTHDPTNNSRYYRWDYQENWIIHSAYQSDLEAKTNPVDTIIARPQQDGIFVCWQSDVSSNIILNTSATLSQDIIVQNPVAFVASSSEKLSNEYCITLNQYALTKDAFSYWQNLKKNTEQLGSIFDAQPSEIKGNIHSVDNPAEPVIGFITMGAPAHKRLFIGNSQVPPAWFQQIKSPYTGCVIDSLYFVDPARNNTNSTLLLYQGFEIPLIPIVNSFVVVVGYSASRSFCADCRFRGTTTRPPFWIDKF